MNSDTHIVHFSDHGRYTETPSLDPILLTQSITESTTTPKKELIFLLATRSASSDNEGIEEIVGRVVEKQLEKQLESQLSPLKDHMTSLNEETVEEIRQLKNALLSANNELLKKNEAIEKLLIARKNTKRIYYAGLTTGLLSILGGVFTDIMYAIVGLGIAITALVGIYEARENGW